MSHDESTRVAEELLAHLGHGGNPKDIALMFGPDVDWEIAGNVGALPRIGRKRGRKAAVYFVRDTHDLLQPFRFRT